MASGGGKNALERFESDIEVALGKLGQRDVSSADNKPGKVLWEIENALHSVQAYLGQEGGEEERERVSSRLLEMGQELAKLGEHDAAVRLGYVPCTIVSNASDLEQTMNAYLAAAKTVAMKLEKYYRLGKQLSTERLDETRTIEDIVLEGLQYVQMPLEKVANMKSTEQREQYYWVVFNGIVLTLSLCEPMVALGHGNIIVKHATLALMAMEAVLPLCVVKYLPWRQRLYELICSCYEQMGNVKAMKKVIARCKKQMHDLRMDEEQATPVPQEVLQQLDIMDRLNITYDLKADIMINGELDSVAAGKLVTENLKINLQTGAIEDCAKFPTIATRIEALHMILRLNGRRSLVHRTSAISMNYMVSTPKQTENVGVLVKAIRLCFTKLNEEPQQQPLPSFDVLIGLTESLFHFEQWDVAGLVLSATSTNHQDDADKTISPLQRKQVELLLALYFLQYPDANPEQFGFDAEDGTRFGGELAHVEGRVFRVNPMRHLAQVVESCTRGEGAMVARTNPDLLTDAALLLWSPFCTAMLDTIKASQASERINPVLLEVTITALRGVHRVLSVCPVDDQLLRGLLSLKYAQLLHQSSLHDSRGALQVLRRTLQQIDVYRHNLLKRNGSLDSLTSFTVAADVIADAPDRKELTALACLQGDLLCMTFEIEIDLAKSDQVRNFMTTEVQAMEKEGNEITLSLGSKSSSSSSNGSLKAVEQRLLAECRHNKYAKALLHATFAKFSGDDEYEEKAARFKRIGSMLDDVEKDEQMLVQQQQLDKAENEGEKEEDDGQRKILQAPIITGRSCMEVTLKLQPWAFPGREPAYYVVYGKLAGSGTDVSLSNDGLDGTGVPIEVDQIDHVIITNLDPNETYVFAAACFDSKHKVLGKAIGLTSKEVHTVSPLPVLFCWGVVARLANETMQNILEDPTNSAISSLHYTRKEHAYACVDFCLGAANKLVDYFIQHRPMQDLWASNPMEDDGLDMDKVLRAPRPVIQAFVFCCLLRNKLLCRKMTSSVIVHKPGGNEMVTLMNYNYKRPVYNEQIERLGMVQYLCLALHCACSLNDKTLILQVASETYRQLVPFFQLRQVEPRVLQALLLIQKGLWQVPRESWTDTVCSIYACCCYELLRIGEQCGETGFLLASLLPGVEQEDDAFEVPKRVDEESASANHMTRTALEALREQHALGFKLRMELGAMNKDNAQILQKIHEYIGNVHPFEKEGDEEIKSVGFDEQILLLLASAKRFRRAGDVKRAWNLLQSMDGEFCPDFLKLMAYICRFTLFFDGISSFQWAEAGQQLLWDLPQDSPAYPLGITGDVLYEEHFEHQEPFESVATHVYPFTEDGDPLGFQDLTDIASQREEERRLREEREAAEAAAKQLAEEEEARLKAEEEARLLEEEQQGKKPPAKKKDEPKKKQEEPERDPEELEREQEEARKWEALEKKRNQRVKFLERRKRLIHQKSHIPTPEEQSQLSSLAEMEHVRAMELFQKWFAVDYGTHLQDKSIYGDGVLDEGPGTDLKWRAVSTESGNSVVPPLKASLSILQEGGGNGPIHGIENGNMEVGGREEEEEGETEGKEQDSGSDANNGEVGVGSESETSEFKLQKMEDAIRATPSILQICARGMVRARYGHCWKQMEKIGKMMWNALQFAWVSPLQFTEEFIDEASLVPVLRTKLKEAREAPLEGVSESDSQPASSARSNNPSPRGGKQQLEVTNNDEEEELEEKVVHEDGSGMRYDWRVIFRASNAVLEMLERVATAEEKIDIDLLWASKLISFCVQVLSNLERWAEVVSMTERFMTAVQCADELVGPVLPLAIFAQRRILGSAQGESDRIKTSLAKIEEDLAEKARKKKRKKERKARKFATEPVITEEEQKLLDEQSTLFAVLEEKNARIKLLQEKLDFLSQKQEELVRDRSTCLEALEKARNLRRYAMTEHFAPTEESLGSLMVQPNGLLTRRSSKAPKLSGRSKATYSVHSKSSKRTTQSRGKRSTASHNQEPEEIVEGSIQSTYVRPCIQAYTSAAQLMRQKQETVMLALTLGELGDFYASTGGKNGWPAAIAAWKDGTDAVLKTVDSVRTWRQIFDQVFLSSPYQEQGQALLAHYGIMGCAVGGVNICKVAKHLQPSASLSEKLECHRMGATMFTALISTGMPHPTRLCDFAAYEVTELFPMVDQNILYSAVRKDALLEALDGTIHGLMETNDPSDLLLTLPLIAIYEYIVKFVTGSLQTTLTARTLKAEVLSRLGLLREAWSNLRDVLSGKCLLPMVTVDQINTLSHDILSTKAPASTNNTGSPRGGGKAGSPRSSIVQDVDSEQKETMQVFKDLASHQYDSAKLPWDESNYETLKFILQEDNACPYVEQLLGRSLMDKVGLCKALLVFRAVEVWRPETEWEMRATILRQVQDTLHKSRAHINYIASVLAASGAFNDAITLLHKSMSNESKGNISRWLRSRLLLAQFLSVTGRHENACEEAMAGLKECETFQESNVKRELLLIQAEALVQLGNMEKAQHLLAGALEKMHDFIQAKLLVAKSLLFSSENEDHMESLACAANILHNQITRLGFFQQERLVPLVQTGSVYLEGLDLLILINHNLSRAYLAQNQTALAQPLIDNALTIGKELPHSLEWLLASLLLMNSKVVPTEEEQETALATALMLGIRDCPYDHKLVHDICCELFAKTGSGHWLLDAERIGKHRETLFEQVSQLVQQAPPTLLDPKSEYETRRQHMGTFHLKQFEREVGLKSLIYAVLAQIEKPRPNLDKLHCGNLKVAVSYLCKVFPAFASHISNVEEVKEYVVESGEGENNKWKLVPPSGGPERPAALCVQWLTDPDAAALVTFLGYHPESIARKVQFSRKDIAGLQKRFASLALRFDEENEEERTEKFKNATQQVAELFQVDFDSVPVVEPTKEAMIHFASAFDLNLGYHAPESDPVAPFWDRMLKK